MQKRASDKALYMGVERFFLKILMGNVATVGPWSNYNNRTSGMQQRASDKAQ